MLAQNEIRTWSDLNGDDIAQDNEIGASPNRLLRHSGRRRAGPTPTSSAGFNTELTAGIQHELVPGHLGQRHLVSPIARTTWSVWTIVSLTLADYTPVTIVSPLDGEEFTVYNLVPSKFGVPPDRIDRTSTDSSLRRNTYNGFEASFTARFGSGGTAFGGWSVERTIDVKCDTNSSTRTRCGSATRARYGMPWRHEFKLAGAYPLPLGLQASAALVSWPGTDRGGRAGERA